MTCCRASQLSPVPRHFPCHVLPTLPTVAGRPEINSTTVHHGAEKAPRPYTSFRASVCFSVVLMTCELLTNELTPKTWVRDCNGGKGTRGHDPANVTNYPAPPRQMGRHQVTALILLKHACSSGNFYTNRYGMTSKHIHIPPR